ncbi:hypothetical protein [Limimaricola cinnabarinus]|uniref:Uncharacterized protein n=1 Tax=Limimaricola cinnabarinus LL-001 TaxID=1337093 RepID=U2Z482_9RHOB|nr:hypothetical protein [Limimaricola cinnabarinus]GAD55852.1 hypothetical protein MBELCI_1904 [Limimaricola cinnabarinus LL-001]
MVPCRDDVSELGAHLLNACQVTKNALITGALPFLNNMVKKLTQLIHFAKNGCHADFSDGGRQVGLLDTLSGSEEDRGQITAGGFETEAVVG